VAIIDLVFVGVFLAVLSWVAGPLVWVPLLAIPVILALAVAAQVPLARSAARAQQLATKRHVVLVESLLGLEAVKSLNAEPVMQREWDTAIAAAARVTGHTRVWSGLVINGTQAIQQGVSVVLIVWGVYLVSEGRITVGALIAANILAGRALAPLATISQTLFRAHYARKAMGALDRLMALPRERDATLRSDLRVTRGTVAFRDVTCRYPGAEHPAVADLSLDIRPGETVALLGRVGSGKTTVGKLLNGLLQPDSGNILIDGHAIAQYDPAELRDGVGYLTQDSELFTGTLRENMTIGRPAATDEQVRQALYLAGMDGFVAANPAGLDVHVGEKGNRLSGGQRQGVALARLLLRRPRVLFLDEPTNAMDQQMEAAFIERIGLLKAEMSTLILCTHRMSLAATADRFVVLDRGRKVLDGPKAEVMAALRAAQARQIGD
jgi:ATP-binding cassette subfamily C protein LapB